jgi:CPA1 family monovalent cation:H+ antiporter
MDTFTTIAILVTISALISYINQRFVKLPGTIGIMVIAISLSILILISGKTLPVMHGFISQLASNIDFTKTLLDVMLAFLLFASALHFDLDKLKEQKLPVLVLSTVGVIGCTTIFGLLFYWGATLIGIEIPFMYCILFGALISPTDPVAVLSVLKKSKIPPSLETIIGGESLFNDGVGILLFVTLREITEDNGIEFSWSHSGQLFVQEVFGGILLGVASGFFCTRLVKKLNDLQTIIMITLAMVMGISVVGGLLHVSIPLAAVAAGLMLSNMKLGEQASSAAPLKELLDKIWGLIDDLLNTILFVMIGLQIVVIPFFIDYWLISLMSIIFVLVARGISITVPTILMRRTLKIDFKKQGILIWAGLRGGISVALALSLPESDYKPLIVSASYLIVIFSIIVQGLTLNKVVEKLVD